MERTNDKAPNERVRIRLGQEHRSPSPGSSLKLTYQLDIEPDGNCSLSCCISEVFGSRSLGSETHSLAHGNLFEISQSLPNADVCDLTGDDFLRMIDLHSRARRLLKVQLAACQTLQREKEEAERKRKADSKRDHLAKERLMRPEVKSLEGKGQQVSAESSGHPDKLKARMTRKASVQMLQTAIAKRDMEVLKELFDRGYKTSFADAIASEDAFLVDFFVSMGWMDVSERKLDWHNHHTYSYLITEAIRLGNERAAKKLIDYGCRLDGLIAVTGPNCMRYHDLLSMCKSVKMLEIAHEISKRLGRG